MRRREFIAGLGGAVTWPRTMRAQPAGRTRRIGVLLPYAEVDLQRQAVIGAFTQRLAEFGWVEGRNLRMEIRWAGSDVAEARRLAKELVALQPDVILSDSTPQTAALQLETRSIPIVFVLVSDPIGSGFVAGLPRPGGNLTGFTHLEGTFGGKWLDVLKRAVPNLKRAAAMFSSATAPYVKSYYLPSYEAAARLSNVEPLIASVGSEPEIEEAIGSLGGHPGGGLVLMPDAFVYNNRSLINSLATQKQNSVNLLDSRFPARRRVTLLRGRHAGHLSSRRFVCKSRTYGGKPSDAAGAGANEIYYDCKSQDRQGTRPRRPAGFACTSRRGDRMKRREFIVVLLGGTTTLFFSPTAARAQSQTLPVLAFLSGNSRETSTAMSGAFRQGLAEGGYVEARNVAIEDRFADGQLDRLPNMAAELVEQHVAVIVATGFDAARAAKNATSTIPIVFYIGNDPVETKLVASLNRPGGNMTGATLITREVQGKRLAMARELLMDAAIIATFSNPVSVISDINLHDLEAAAASVGQRLLVLRASSDDEIKEAFFSLVQRGANALFVNSNPFFYSRTKLIVELAARHRVPTIFSSREFGRRGRPDELRD